MFGNYAPVRGEDLEGQSEREKFELDPAQAAIQGTLMFSGALLQTFLAIVPSPWKTTSPERSALFSVYQKLADYARPGTLVRNDAWSSSGRTTGIFVEITIS
jgi:hypothetical protein